MLKFKEEHPYEKRIEESRRIREKYPDRVPVVVEKNPQSDIPEMDKKKFLVPADLTTSQFIYIIRKRISLPPEQAIFIFIHNSLPPSTHLMSELYKEHKDEDGFLYVVYSGESTFGVTKQSNYTYKYEIHSTNDRCFL